MAQLKDTIVSGSLRVNGEANVDKLNGRNPNNFLTVSDLEKIICDMPAQLQYWAAGVGNEPPMPSVPSDSDLKTFMESDEMSGKLTEWIENGTILKIPNIESSADRLSRSQEMYYINKNYLYDNDGSMQQNVINYIFVELTSNYVNVDLTSNSTKVKKYNEFYISYNTKTKIWKWNEDSYSVQGMACFTRNTEIFTSNGLENIQDLNIGDLVLSYNKETGDKELKEIDKLVSHTADVIYNIDIDAEIIKSSWSHPFYVEGKGKVLAKDLVQGDILRCYDDRLIKIKQITVDNNPQDVYEIRVKDNNNYYVGVNSVLVYNEDSILDN